MKTFLESTVKNMNEFNSLPKEKHPGFEKKYFWIHKGKEKRRIDKEKYDIETFLKDGWNLGSGLIVSEKTRKHLSEINKGYLHTEETKKKMSDNHKSK